MKRELRFLQAGGRGISSQRGGASTLFARTVMLSVALLLLWGCPGREEDEAETSAETDSLRFAYSVQDLSNPYFMAVTNGARDRARELDIQLEIHDAKADGKRQSRALREFILGDMDAVICSPIDVGASVPLVQLAHSRGVPFINPNQEIPGNDANINLNDYQYGYAGGLIAGAWIRDQLDGSAQVGVLSYPDIAAIQERATGIVDGIHSVAPEAQIVAESTAIAPQGGVEATLEILSDHPEVKVIAAINDAGALGALTVLRQYADDPNEFGIIGLDATAEAIAEMKEPNSIFRGTVDIDPYGTGILIIDTAVRVLSNGPIVETIRIPMVPVTQKNIHLY